MELNFAFLASSAEVASDGRFFVLGGGIDGFNVTSVPGYVPTLAVIVSLHFPPDECGPDYPLLITISQPDGTVMAGSHITTLLRPRIPPEAPDVGANLKVSINMFGLYFPQFGRHRMNFVVGDRPVGDVEFNVAR